MRQRLPDHLVQFSIGLAQRKYESLSCLRSVSLCSWWAHTLLLYNLSILDGNIIRFMDFTALTIKVFDLEYENSTVQSSTSMQKTDI
jgi:hypothetical protein